MEFREIGIEREFFMVGKDKEIVEPIKYGFPADAFGFLVELRSEPGAHLDIVKMTWDMTRSYWEHRAMRFGMELLDVPFLFKDNNIGKYFYDKYNAALTTDYTQNIYNTDSKTKLPSHHTGIFFNWWGSTRQCLLTAGMHVHFSIRDETGIVVPFTIQQITEIVTYMDNKFENEISTTYRSKGEWEPKAHGFEYRSIPCNANVYKVLQHSFKILREVR